MQTPKSTTDSITQVLNKHVYADKIEVLVEELAKHAKAAHEKAGCPERPFCVFLPTSGNPVFDVRDFGTGYSLDEVVRVFSSHSVVADSLDGKGDLSAKAALGYATSFSVRSFEVDELHTCIVSVDQDTFKAVPKDIVTQQINGHPDSTGVTIIVPVQQADIERFKNAAFKILPNFNVSVMLGGEALNVHGAQSPAPLI